MNRVLKRLIALFLVILLIGANLIILGEYTIVKALTEEELKEQDAETNHRNVEFNSYFYGETHTATFDIGAEEAMMYVKVKVNNAGYLENGTIEFQNTNFKLKEGISNENIQSIDIANNKIVLNRLQNGSEIVIELPTEILEGDSVSLDYFNKETTTKFTATYTDGEGDKYEISKEIINKLAWRGTAEVDLVAEDTKYVPYATNENYGVLVQTKINTGITDSTLPIKTTSLEVIAPMINNTRPTTATVVSTKTEATNGKADGFEFNSSNYTYDANSGIVGINVSNLQDSISWKKGVMDEYLVTFLFEGREIYDYAVENGINSTVTVNATITAYNNEEVQAVNTTTVETSHTERYHAITDFDVLVPEQISKGYLYAGYDGGNAETEYSVKYVATIISANITTSLQFNQSQDVFLTDEEAEGSTTANGKNYTYNKRVEVSQTIFNKLLGEDGEIIVKAEDGTELGKINKDTTVENGIYVLDISAEDNNQLVIETTAPITEGQLEITIVKAIKAKTDYSKAQMQDFTKMEMEVVGTTNTTTFTSSAQTLLKEPETKVDLELNKTSLTTVVENQNVEIRAVLDTSSEYNALYKNPTLKITLPYAIKEVELKSSNILLANGLTIKSTNITEENNRKVITVVLEGTQTDYTIDAEYKGAIVVLNMDLTAETLTSTGTDRIQLAYTNENEMATNKEGTISKDIKFVAPGNLVTASGISDYKQGEAEILSISDETTTVPIDTYSDEVVASLNGTVINNFSNDISNITILGRIPSQGNKKIDTNTDLGSTFTTQLAQGLAISNVDASDFTLYYSDNQNATTDLADSNNGWSETPMTTSKSFLIDFNDSYTMASGERISFEYDVTIPENLEPNNITSGMYKVYYTNNSEIGSMQESKNSGIIQLSTGQGPELEATLTSTADVVREGQIIKMKVDVKNTGDVDATNVRVNINAPEYITFCDYGVGNGFFEEDSPTKVIELGNISAGQSASTYYYIKVDDDMAVIDNTILDSLATQEEMEEYVNSVLSFPKKITNTVSISTNEFSGGITSNECVLQVQDGVININIYTDVDESNALKNGDIIRTTINLFNNNNAEDLTNTIVTINLPQGIKYNSGNIKDGLDSSEEITDGISYDETNNRLTINIGTLYTQKYIMLELEVTNDEGNISLLAEVKADNTETHYSNVIQYEVEKVNLEISELTSSPRYIRESENVEYKFSITNHGSTVVTQVNIKDTLPNLLQYIEAKYIYNGKEVINTTLQNGIVDFTIPRIEPNETIEITITARAQLLPDTNDKEIQNKVSISANSFATVETNTVTNFIEYYEDAHNTENGDNNNTPSNNRHRITGTAWIDANQNGQRDSSEAILANMQVILLNRNGNSIVKDPDTNVDKITTTSSDGTYQFTNLPNGEYLVVFIYDSTNYTLTEYQKDGVDESFNSDAIEINLTFNGERRIAGITDVVTIKDENARDIDIGLYTATRFDLSLEKYVNKITLTTPTIGTVEYPFNSQVGKVEVAERNVGRSSAVIEYRIVVKNEGSVPGYVSKIVDYLPEELSFSTELNPDWYLSDNGNIYNASLANEIINPGETKEVTLILTVRITDNLIGNHSNSAEIYESYNELGLTDVDSTEANMVSTEDDMSTADAVLSIVTGGQVILYIVIGLVVAGLIVIGIYEIKKHVLKKKY